MKTIYSKLSTGARIRVSPQRPWRGKSERRRVLKQRRIERREMETVQFGIKTRNLTRAEAEAMGLPCKDKASPGSLFEGEKPYEMP